MEASYEIPNLINQGKNVGTCKNPYFFHITSGERVKKTAIFHAQIGTNYYEYYIRWVNSETLNLMCTDRTCPAKAFHAGNAFDICVLQLRSFLFSVGFSKIERNNFHFSKN